MDREIKQCQNCKSEFTIEPEDFAFYDKIKVPAPTWCPECRFMRRTAFRNERKLYERKCDLCQKEIIAMYPTDVEFPVYCNTCWHSDKWDSADFAKDYDFSNECFNQFKELSKIVPRPALIGSKNIGSPYVNYTADVKNCYLCMGCGWIEDSAYIYRTLNSKESFDSFVVLDSERTYENINCTKNSKISFSRNSENSLESAFLYNCKSVSNCIACVNLRNKKNNIFNQQYFKDAYNKLVESEYNLGFYSKILQIKREFKKFVLNFPRKFSHQINVVNSTGDDLVGTKNCQNCFSIKKSENVKNGYFGSGLKDSYDLNFADTAELVYESTNITENYKKLFSLNSWYSKEINYCDLCFNSSDCFACIGLRNKQYCILNKQYSKSEYEDLVPKIIEHMNKMPYVDSKGRIYKYGEFFPPDLSPFCYNETVTQEYFPLTKEQAIEQGYKWKEPEQRNLQIDIRTEDLPDHIKDVPDSIVGKVIQCQHAVSRTNADLSPTNADSQSFPRSSAPAAPKAGSSPRSSAVAYHATCNEQCTTAFKIIRPELEFYRKMNLPLPRLCPNCRHYQRIKQRNPLKLWKRKCMCQGQQSDIGNQISDIGHQISDIRYQNTIEHFHGNQPCPNEFETTYSPDRPEIVYCESCYNQEVA